MLVYPMKMLVDGTKVVKPVIKQTNEESKDCDWNGKQMYDITKVVMPDNYKHISTYQISKEAWDNLEVTHDGTSMVKKPRLIMLNRDYQLLQMEEDKMFDSFYARFTNIITISHNLGHHIEEEM